MQWSGWEKICHANIQHKEAGVAIIILDKVDFMTEFSRGKEGLFIIQQKDMTIKNVYAPNNRA